MIFFKRINNMKSVRLEIVNIIGNTICADVDDAEKVYQSIKKTIEENKKVVLSFKNVEIITSAFLNQAIGQLLKDYTRDELKEMIIFENIKKEDSLLLRRVIDSAELYYKHPDAFKKSIKEILDEDDED